MAARTQTHTHTHTRPTTLPCRRTCDSHVRPLNNQRDCCGSGAERARAGETPHRDSRRESSRLLCSRSAGLQRQGGEAPRIQPSEPRSISAVCQHRPSHRFLLSCVATATTVTCTSHRRQLRVFCRRAEPPLRHEGRTQPAAHGNAGQRWRRLACVLLLVARRQRSECNDVKKTQTNKRPDWVLLAAEITEAEFCNRVNWSDWWCLRPAPLNTAA